MKRQALLPGLIAALAVGFLLAHAQQPTMHQTSTLKIGDMAPDFTLPDQDGKQVKLSDLRGNKNVVLAFYVLAFTGG